MKVQRIMKCIVLIFIVASTSGCNGLMSNGLPTCDSNEATQLVGKFFEADPAVHRSGQKFLGVSGPYEQAHNEDGGVRSCMGMLVSTGGQRLVRYDLTWKDRDNGITAVDVRAE